jgi:hypothetical protein
MPHVFISYVRENTEDVQRLRDELTRHGVQVWLDRNEIAPGTFWQDAIRCAIRSGDFFIACFSKECSERDKAFMNEELILAIEELRQRSVNKPWFIPIKLNECDVPDQEIGAGKTLRDLQWVELYADWEAGMQRILGVVQPCLMENALEIEMFIQRLRSDNPTDRQYAANVLGEIGNSLAVPALIKALNDVDQEVQAKSLGALARIAEPIEAIQPALLQTLQDESELVTYHAINALKKINRVGKVSEVAQNLLESGKNWLAISYALQYLDMGKSSLLISDETDFASELGVTAQTAGFRLVTINSFAFPTVKILDELFDEILNAYKLLILVRGEHYTQYGNDDFYTKLRTFVYEGGNLFATSWVSWETKFHPAFADVLPFTHIEDTYNENVRIRCQATGSKLAKSLFPNPISYRTSFELLQNKATSSVLFETDDGIPIFGFHRFGKGYCYYLNSCQHFCLGSMPSPLQPQNELQNALLRVFEWIYRTEKK